MSQTMANLVDVRGVSFSRGNRLIFDDISLTVPRGKITAIMGPSGIGKTTLLNYCENTYQIVLMAKVNLQNYLYIMELHQ